MSERKAKKERVTKRAAEYKPKPDKLTVITNTVGVLLIVAVLALGIWAVADKLSKSAGSASQQDEEQQVSVSTVANRAEELGMTAEDFLAEYGLADNESVTADTGIQTAETMMSLENYAKYIGITYDEFLNTYGIAGVDEVTPETALGDAMEYMTVANYAGLMGITTDDVRDQCAAYGLDIEVTDEMTMGVLSEQMQAKLLEQQAAEESSAESEDGTESEEGAEGEAEQEPEADE